MYSTRTFNTDGLSGTDDGYLSHYLAEGTTCLMQHGNEYVGLYPLWDWQRIPGTTVELAPHIPGEPKRPGESDFVGGVSDGTLGVAAFDLKREGLSGKKAWFFFGDMVVCLGANIRCNTEHPVVTTVNQCRQSGSVALGKGNKSETFQGGRAIVNVAWVHHDGMGYVFPKASRVELETESRTETWKRISTQRSGQAVTDSVFTLAIPHGAKPKGKAYAYAVFPGKEAAVMPDLARQVPFEVVANSAKQQVVWCKDDEALGIVFYQPGKIKAAGFDVTADRACALLIRRVDGVWKLSAADPAAGSGILNMTVKQNNEAPRTITVTLPDGLMAGGSVQAVITGFNDL
jgi:chondroitin AC lyase